LGRVLVKSFAGRGFRVIALDIDREGLSQFNNNDNILIRTTDVTLVDQIMEVVKELDLERSGLDILISLAGIYHTIPVTEADPGIFRMIMNVNLQGTVNLVQCLLNPLIKSQGRVIVVSSESYKIQTIFQPYMISKAALEAYCRVARQELALKGVKLSVIRPGAIQTPLLNWMKANIEPEKYPVYDKEYMASFRQSIKMVGKISSPESVARKIIRASVTRHPKRIYWINNSIMLNIISLLPKRLFEKIVVRKFMIKSNKHKDN